MDSLIESVAILQFTNEGHSQVTDVVIRETPLTLFVNNQEMLTLLCTPDHQQNLALGFLYSEGLINSKAEIKSITVDENRGIVRIALTRELVVDDNFRKARTITSGCARGLTFHLVFDKWVGDAITSRLIVKSETIVEIISGLNDQSILFKKTGGVHCSILYRDTTLLMVREDIGRHNTIDKIIGECLAQDIHGEDKILVTSGRISSEMLFKVARWNIPLLISRSAPTSAAIKFADEIGMTLIGFARGKRMNIYTHNWRIKN